MDPLHVEAHPNPRWWSPPPSAVGHRLIATSIAAAQITAIAKELDFAIDQRLLFSLSLLNSGVLRFSFPFYFQTKRIQLTR